MQQLLRQLQANTELLRAQAEYGRTGGHQGADEPEKNLEQQLKKGSKERA